MFYHINLELKILLIK